MHMIELLYYRKTLRVNEQIVKNGREKQPRHLPRSQFVLEEAVKGWSVPSSRHRKKCMRHLTFFHIMLK